MAKKSDSHWISFSDIMTGLMIIFMFIAISYIMEVQNKQQKRDEIFKEYEAIKEKLYTELDSCFRDEFNDWKVELDKDLSIKFTNPEFLFASGRFEIRDTFKNILNVFLPRYFDILLQEKYKDKISEIRIEGHTDDVPMPQLDSDPYIANIKLSQGRSSEVLKHFRRMQYYEKLDDNDEARLQFMLTANGLSFGRTVDNNRHLTFESGGTINRDFSRRVEFRIVTTSEALVEKVLKELQDGSL